MLDDAGLTNVQIVASGGLDEDRIDRLTAGGAPIDLFGVGTDLAVSSDAPALDIAYKLVEYAGVGRMKLSVGKANLPGRKQIFRYCRGQVAVYDVIGRHDESLPASPLLSPVMLSGRRCDDKADDLDSMRSYAKGAIEALAPDHRTLEPPITPYEIKISSKLAEYQQSVLGRLRAASTDGE
jgi:nicotinate phosphoribosyltransferase